jgi:nicotinate-nucleotide pyrophosphorylase (carboxylating)
VTALPPGTVEALVAAALAEDLGLAGDITSRAIAPAAPLTAAFVARHEGVVAGLDFARRAFAVVDDGARFITRIADGGAVAAGHVIAEVTADARALLAGERTALNVLTLLSGTATLTRRYVDAVAGTRARITSTRKTLPGLRAAQKHAVRCGGGVNHRFGLYDAMLIKDNHIAAAGGVAQALQRARAAAGHMVAIEIEVDSLAQLADALPFAPHAVLLDNMSPVMLEEAVAMVRASSPRTIVEASGGVSLPTVRRIAETGVDVISVGALTHSAPALDIGLDIAG